MAYRIDNSLSIANNRPLSSGAAAVCHTDAYSEAGAGCQMRGSARYPKEEPFESDEPSVATGHHRSEVVQTLFHVFRRCVRGAARELLASVVHARKDAQEIDVLAAVSQATAYGKYIDGEKL